MEPRRKFLHEILTKCRPDIKFYLKSLPEGSQKGSKGPVEPFTFRRYLPEATFASAAALAAAIVLRRDFKSAPSFAVPSMLYELMDAVEELTKPSPANSVLLAKPPMEDCDGIVKLALALFATVETAAAVNKAKAALRSTFSSALAVTTVWTFDLLVVCVCYI